MKILKSLIKSIFNFILVGGLIWIFATKIVANGEIVGRSMEPTLHNGERIIGLQRSNPKRGDVVVFTPPDNPKELYIKRVIGLPGDLISFKDDILYINNKPQEEPYLEQAKIAFKQRNLKNYTDNFDLFNLTSRSQVPINSYFVMGDNRPNSTDSRSFGFVRQTAIQSIIWMKYYPFNQIEFF